MELHRKGIGRAPKTTLRQFYSNRLERNGGQPLILINLPCFAQKNAGPESACNHHQPFYVFFRTCNEVQADCQCVIWFLERV